MFKLEKLQFQTYMAEPGENIYDFCHKLSYLGACKPVIGKFNDIYIICDNYQNADMLIDNYNKALYKVNGLYDFICEFRCNGEIETAFDYGIDKWKVISKLQRRYSEYEDFSIISVQLLTNY